ncbi:hypothetical protein GGI43DRAFT_397543 [Trichoderma evansii]
MGYDWDSHKETCHRLYIREGWSLERIMAYLKADFDFTPSRRAFQSQFRRWDFPLKTKSRCQDERLLGRIKELWEQNFSPNEMIKMLLDEGFEAGPHEVMKLRLKNRWLFRGPNNEKAKAVDPAAADPNDEPELPENLESSALLHVDDSTISLRHDEKEEGEREVEGEDEREADAEGAGEGASKHPLSKPSPGFGHDNEANATEPAENQADKNNKKKRNRFKMDASGAIVRFPSEMTIDDARSKLGLDKATYRLLRAEFRNICIAMDVSKKSAGSDKWEAAKTRLLHERPELYHKLWTPEDELEMKQAALDVICTDIAKRMRSMDSRMSVAEVKNALGMNPQQARDARVAFNEVLTEAGFTRQLDSTPTSQQWNDLRRQWGNRSDVIKKTLDDIDSDPSNHLKVKALDALSRDTLKRLRDNRASRSSRTQQQSGQTEPDMSQFPTHHLHTNHDDTGILLGPRLSAEQMDLGDGLSTSALDDVSDASYTPQAMLSPDSGAISSYLPLSLHSSGVVGVPLDAPNVALRPQPTPLSSQRIFNPTGAPNVHLDSTVGQSLLLASNTGTGFLNEPYVAQPYGSTHSSAQMFHHDPPVSAAYAVYFRMHPSSTFITSESLWIATMSSKSVQELRQAATDKLPEAACLRIEGILKDSNGSELPLVINTDEHLAAFFSYNLGETPTFSVQLVWKTGDTGRF